MQQFAPLKVDPGRPYPSPATTQQLPSPSPLRKGDRTERNLLLLTSFTYCMLRSIHPCGSECGCLGLVAAGSFSHAMDLPPRAVVCGFFHQAAVDILV